MDDRFAENGMLLLLSSESVASKLSSNRNAMKRIMKKVLEARWLPS